MRTIKSPYQILWGKLGHNFEVFEEIDEAGSFVEDQKVQPETIIKTHLVRKF